jgi:hypothetical protein
MAGTMASLDKRWKGRAQQECESGMVRASSFFSRGGFLFCTDSRDLDNFHGIDFIHDSIKASLRTRKIRRRRTEGLRGWLVNIWDGSQGWVLVTIVGMCFESFGQACVLIFHLRVHYGFHCLRYHSHRRSPL